MQGYLALQELIRELEKAARMAAPDREIPVRRLAPVFETHKTRFDVFIIRRSFDRIGNGGQEDVGE